MVRIRAVVAALEQRPARRGEGDDVVDVAVGPVVLRDRIGEPDDPGRTEGVAEHRLDRRTVVSRVPVGVEQAALGRHQRSRSVAGDGTTFEHQGYLVHGQTEMHGDARADRPVVGVGVVFVAPGVEPEVQGMAGSRSVAHDDRTGVADPRVVDSRHEHLDVVPLVDVCGRQRRSVFRVNDHDHPLVIGEGLDHGGVRSACRRELRSPQIGLAFGGRPRDERALMARGLGGNAQTDRQIERPRRPGVRRTTHRR